MGYLKMFLVSALGMLTYLVFSTFLSHQFRHIEKTPESEDFWLWIHEPTYVTLSLFVLASLIPLINLFVAIMCMFLTGVNIINVFIFPLWDKRHPLYGQDRGAFWNRKVVDDLIAWIQAPDESDD